MASSVALTQFDIMLKLASSKTYNGPVMDPNKKEKTRDKIGELLTADNNVLANRTEETKTESATKALSKDRMRSYQRVWTAVTKYLVNQCNQGKCVDLPLVGKFRKLNGSDGDSQYTFMPHLDFIGSGNFSFPENESNVSPFAKASMGFQHSVLTMSLTAVSAVCDMDREQASQLLKAIFVKFVSITAIMVTYPRCRSKTEGEQSMFALT